MDAGAIVAVSGVQTQPSFVDPLKRVTKYKVSVSTNNESWSWVDGGTIFNESARYVDTATNVFTMPVLARYVRIVVDSWENGNPALRAGLLVLPVWTGALRCPMGTSLGFLEVLLWLAGCGPGSFSDGGASECRTCSAGTYSTARVNTQCQSCGVGYFCPAGSRDAQGSTYSVAAGGLIDHPCPAGTYGAESGLPSALHCADCPAGSFSRSVKLTNASQCEICPKGAFCPPRSPTPTLCPAGTTRASPRGKSEEECELCPVGSYSDKPGLSEPCKPCPDGRTSKRGSANVTSCRGRTTIIPTKLSASLNSDAASEEQVINIINFGASELDWAWMPPQALENRNRTPWLRFPPLYSGQVSTFLEFGPFQMSCVEGLPLGLHEVTSALTIAEDNTTAVRDTFNVSFELHCDPGRTNATNSFVTSALLSHSTVHKPFEWTLFTVDRHNHNRSKSEAKEALPQEITASLTDQNGSILCGAPSPVGKCQLELLDQDNGKYTVRATARTVGIFFLNVRVSGSSVRGAEMLEFEAQPQVCDQYSEYSMELQRCKCFAGYQSKEAGSQHDPPTCLPCPAGQYKGEDDLCSPCPPGTRSEPGSSQCDPCKVGEIQDKPNACTKCPAGSVPRQRCSLQLCSSLAAMSLQEATPSSKAASNVSRAQQVRSGVHQS